jgi:hypothetical protein
MKKFDIKKNLSLIYLGLCAIFTVVSLSYATYVYFSWDNPIEKDPEVLEIKLPVMKWSQYSTLSKQHEDGIVSKED